MKLVWKIGGEAGYGILSTGKMFSKIMKEHGYHVFSTTEYPSLIRGGHNTFTVRAEDNPINSHSEKVDVLVALDELTFDKHKDELTDNGAIIYDKSLDISNKKIRKDIMLYAVPLEDFAKKYKNLKKVMMATIGVGASTALLEINKNIVEELFKKRFKDKKEKVVEENIDAFKKGYKNLEKRSVFKISVEEKEEKPDTILVDGNTAIALGAIKAGLKLMSSYPMTPATSIMHYIAKYQEEHNIIMYQAEDEISSLNTALGASYTGARSMAATSGGGFALMNETLSLAGMSETPVVIVVAQRPGPATGLPTRTEQGDLLFTIHAGHGEFPRIVITPGDPNECFELTLKSFNLADRYQTPVIILTDKYQAVSLKTTKPFSAGDYVMDRGLLVTEVREELESKKKYKRYRITDSGISPRTIPGVKNGIQCSIGDEHDEEGYIVEEPHDRQVMIDKRARKTEWIKEELEDECVSVYGNEKSRNVILSWGSTKGIILESIKNLDYKFVHIKIIHPFPKKELVENIGDYNKLVVIEQNKSSQLSSIVDEKTKLKITHKLLKYDGRPMNPEKVSDFLRRKI